MLSFFSPLFSETHGHGERGGERALGITCMRSVAHQSLRRRHTRFFARDDTRAVVFLSHIPLFRRACGRCFGSSNLVHNIFTYSSHTIFYHSNEEILGSIILSPPHALPRLQRRDFERKLSAPDRNLPWIFFLVGFCKSHSIFFPPRPKKIKLSKLTFTNIHIYLCCQFCAHWSNWCSSVTGKTISCKGAMAQSQEQAQEKTPGKNMLWGGRFTGSSTYLL